MVIIGGKKEDKDWPGVKINGKIMKIVKNYKYLGEMIIAKGTDETTVEKIINQAKEIITAILTMAKLEEVRSMQTNSMRLIKPCLDIRLLYNSTTWINIPKLYQEELETIQYQTCRRIPKGTPKAALVMEFDFLN